MIVYPNLSQIAGMIADPSRARMLVALLNVVALPASELAAIARVKPQTASQHLAKLVAAGLLTMEPHGRHRYYKIASPEVAIVLETLATISKDSKPTTTQESKEMRAIRAARTCYGHLAGGLGVRLCEHFAIIGILNVRENSFDITSKGEEEFGKIGISIQQLRSTRRAVTKPCLDWSERKYHLAGSVGVALTDWMFSQHFLKRIKESRAVALTDIGKVFLLSQWDFSESSRK